MKKVLFGMVVLISSLLIGCTNIGNSSDANLYFDNDVRNNHHDLSTQLDLRKNQISDYSIDIPTYRLDNHEYIYDTNYTYDRNNQSEYVDVNNKRFYDWNLLTELYVFLEDVQEYILDAKLKEGDSHVLENGYTMSYYMEEEEFIIYHIKKDPATHVYETVRMIGDQLFYEYKDLSDSSELTYIQISLENDMYKHTLVEEDYISYLEISPDRDVIHCTMDKTDMMQLEVFDTSNNELYTYFTRHYVDFIYTKYVGNHDYYSFWLAGEVDAISYNLQELDGWNTLVMYEDTANLYLDDVLVVEDIEVTQLKQNQYYLRFTFDFDTVEDNFFSLNHLGLDIDLSKDNLLSTINLDYDSYLEELFFFDTYKDTLDNIRGTNNLYIPD
jgi:hypothetical protein